MGLEAVVKEEDVVEVARAVKESVKKGEKWRGASDEH